MSGFNEWFNQYWERLKEYNVEPDEDMLWDTWQESKKKAIERTKAVVTATINKIETEYIQDIVNNAPYIGEYYQPESNLLDKNKLLQAINDAEVE